MPQQERVNIAVFIVKNLPEFRITISILAFVSGLMLNSWAGLNIYRMLQQRRPDHPIVNERNQEIVLVVGMAVIIEDYIGKPTTRALLLLANEFLEADKDVTIDFSDLATENVDVDVR